MKSATTHRSICIEDQALHFLRVHWRWAAGILVAVVLATLGAREIYQRSKPEHTLKVIDRIQSPVQVDQYAEYFTPRGNDLIKWLLQDGLNSVGNEKFTFGKPVHQGSVCTIDVADDQGTRMVFQLVKDGRWKFDDIYIATIKGKQIDLWVSYIKDHPIKSMFRANWREICGAFFQGVVIGLGL